MSILRRFLILGFLLVAAAPGVRAQSVALGNGNSLALYGLTFTVSSCTLSGSACGASNLILENVAAGRGNIEFQVRNSTASNPIISRAANAGTGTTQLQFTIAVSQPVGNPATTVTSLSLNNSGIRSINCTGSGTGCEAGTTATAVIDNISLVTGLVSHTQGLTSNSPSLQTLATVPDPFTPDNAFSFRETLSVTTSANNYDALTLRLNNVGVLFRAAPEPASISALLVGLAGLVVARRRRRS